MEWRWDSSSRKWEERRQGEAIGRMYYVPPNAGEWFCAIGFRNSVPLNVSSFGDCRSNVKLCIVC